MRRRTKLFLFELGLMDRFYVSLSLYYHHILICLPLQVYYPITAYLIDKVRYQTNIIT